MTATSERSQLQTQIGQEVIYLLLTSAILGCVILAAYVLLNVTPHSDQQAQIARLTQSLAAAEQKVAQLATQLAAKEREAKVAAKATDKPPIIVLREADGFNFEQGSAEISAAFEERIRAEIVPQIVTLAMSYQANVVEVIGHTDGVPVGPNLRAKANLDITVGQFVDGQHIEAPIPYDNAGLGMARAIAMVKSLRTNGLPDGYQILPLSAGSLISPADRYSPSSVKNNDPARRRIEIRLRRRHA